MLQAQCYIELSGATAGAALIAALERVEVETSLHLPDLATLTIHDPRLTWVDSSELEPGVPLRITARQGRQALPIFDGEIVELEPEFGPGAARLIVRAFDRLHRLARGRHARSFVNLSDADLATRLADEVGLRAAISPTPQIHAHLFQHNESSLDLLRRRAAALGYLLYVRGETLCMHPPTSEQPPLTLAWGREIVSFRPRLSTLEQVSRVAVRGWNPLTKQAIRGEASVPAHIPAIGLPSNGGALTERAFDLAAQELLAHGAVHSQAEADQLAQAVAERHGSRFIEAEGTGPGLPTLLAGVAVQVDAVGRRFSGSYFVTTASHSFDANSGYQCTFSVSGLHPATLLSLLQQAPPNSEGVGVVVGIVTDTQDPEQLGRVKLAFPWLAPDHASDWTRVAGVGAGAGRGTMFLPEVNDEVLVGFEHGSLQHPYVIGGLWNGVDLPPLSGGALLRGGVVQQRVIRSRSGHEVAFVEEEPGGGGALRIRTGAGRSLTLSDTDQGLNIHTMAHEISLDDRGQVLAVRTQGNLQINALGQVTIVGQAGVTLSSPAGIAISGQGPVSIDSPGSLAVKARGSLELVADGLVRIQGGLVKIN